MTCLEKYMQENPEVNPDLMVSKHCPNGARDIEDPDYCDFGATKEFCTACWSRELKGTEAVKPKQAPRAEENALRVMLDPGAKMPTRAHKLDAGYDLYSPVDVRIFPKWKGGKDNSVVIDTGVHVQIPEGYVGDIEPKSGLMVEYGILTDGTIDAGYTGSVRVKLFNLGNKICHIEKGQKIAQLVIKKIITPEIEVVDSLEETERGSGGFGSTGKF